MLFLLLQSSPYFEAILSGNWEEADEYGQTRDLEFESNIRVAKIFFKFVFSHDWTLLDEASEETLLTLMVLADKYDYPQMAKYSAYVLFDKIGVAVGISYSKVAYQTFGSLNFMSLKARTFKFIQDNLTLYLLSNAAE